MDESLLPPGAVLDPAFVAETLSKPPFVSVPGVFNLRDFGNAYPAAPSSTVKPGLLFRSGEVSHIRPEGKAVLQTLGVAKVFDLRSDVEKAKYGAAAEIDGIEFVRAPIMDEAMDPVGIAQRLKAFADDESDAFFKMNTQILLTGGPALEKILVHLRDSPGRPCLVHCTAGKDRSGLLAAVILMLLGVDDETIIQDYALTTVGLQPVLPLFVQRFSQEQVYRDNWKGALSIATARPQSMRAILDWLRAEFGSAEGYVRAHTGLSAEDVETVRRNLLQAASGAASSS